jgi:hypothetical protein
MNVFRAPTGARFSVAVRSGIFPDAVSFGTWGDAENPAKYKVEWPGSSDNKLRWRADTRGFLFVGGPGCCVYHEEKGTFELAWRHDSTCEGGLPQGAFKTRPSDAEFSPDGTSVFIAIEGCNGHSELTCVLQVDTATGTEQARIALPGLELQPTRLSVHPDGRRVALSSHEPEGIYLAEIGVAPKRIARGSAKDLAFSPDGSAIAVAGDKGARVLDLNGKVLWKQSWSCSCWSVAWLSAERVVFFCGVFTVPTVWIVDLRDGSVVTCAEGSDGFVHAGPGESFGSTVGGRFFSWRADGTLTRRIDLPRSSSSAALAPDGRVLSSNSRNKALLYPARERFAVVTGEAKDDASEERTKHTVFDTRAAAEQAAAKLIAARTAKGYSLVEVEAALSKEARTVLAR